MTDQFSEILLYDGAVCSMCTNPLDDYFALGGEKPEFSGDCTALHRGYVGAWDIVIDRLYLVHLHGMLEDGNVASLATLFPDYPDRVFAHWYTGTVRVPQGELLNYDRAGYAGSYERDLFLCIQSGIVVSSHVVQNGIG